MISRKNYELYNFIENIFAYSFLHIYMYMFYILYIIRTNIVMADSEYCCISYFLVSLEYVGSFTDNESAVYVIYV